MYAEDARVVSAGGNARVLRNTYALLALSILLLSIASLPRYAVCKAIGLDQSTLSRFMASKAGLALETVDKLGELLELKLVTTKKPAKGKER